MPTGWFAGLSETNNIGLKAQHVHTTKDILTVCPEPLSYTVFDTGAFGGMTAQLLFPQAK